MLYSNYKINVKNKGVKINNTPIIIPHSYQNK